MNDPNANRALDIISIVERRKIIPIQNLASFTKLVSPNIAKREELANIKKPLTSDIGTKYFGDSFIHSRICLMSIFPFTENISDNVNHI